mmetsp:Transcript_13455/g.30508  ORF Transcript_13455/g.30508 Transcript_13455/m.30508 type:complete len:408 (+) Transcript_13455:49-1272(+)
MPTAVEVEEVAEGLEDAAEDRELHLRLAGIARARRWEVLLEDTDTHPELDSVEASRANAHQLSGAAAAAASSASGPDGQILVRGVIRYCFMLLDMTDAVRQPDYRPRRHEFIAGAAAKFVTTFLAENPMAEIGIGALRGGTCEIVSPLSSSAEELTRRLTESSSSGPSGFMSIVSGLLRGLQSLEVMPPYGTREILCVTASLATNDPVETSLDEVVEMLTAQRVMVSVVSVSPEMRALQYTCSTTRGSSAVALNSGHFESLLMKHVHPPATTSRTAVARLVAMGFPREIVETQAPLLCVCHGWSRRRLYCCPRCEARVCTVPMRCPSCELPLTSTSTLMRSFRYLAPAPAFQADDAPRFAESSCSGCGSVFKTDETASACKRCGSRFCKVCEGFLQVELRECPGCLA